MTDKPTDAVAQARDAVFAQMKTLASPSFDAARLAQAFQRYESTLIAAVRAECADHVAFVAALDAGEIAQVISRRGLKNGSVTLWNEDDLCFGAVDALAAFRAATQDTP